jgi:tetratricopeptide (TPR) repeat protein
MRIRSTLLTLALFSGVAHADAVQKLVDEAMALYERAGALAKLETAYANSKRADILFGMGRIHVDRGDCVRAIEVYRQFLESKPGPRSTQIVTEKIAECQAILARSEPALEPEPEPERAPSTPQTRTIERPWYTDVAGDVLVIAGVGALGASAYFANGARADLERAKSGGANGVTLADYTMLRERADDRRSYAFIAAGVGGALLLGGLVKFAVGDRTEIVPVASPSVASIAIGGRF